MHLMRSFWLCYVGPSTRVRIGEVMNDRLSFITSLRENTEVLKSYPWGLELLFFGIGDPLALFSHGDSAVYWPAVLLAHLRCKYRAQQTSDAEDGDQEGPDQRHLPLLQREIISLCRRCVHQLLYKLQAPFVSVWPSDSVCGSGCVCTCACARLCVCVCVCVYNVQ